MQLNGTFLVLSLLLGGAQPVAQTKAATHQCSCNIERFRTKAVPQPGFHLACVQRAEGEGEGDVHVIVYKDSLDDGTPPLSFRIAAAEASTASLRAGLERAVAYRKQTNHWPPDKKQPWALFAAEGGHRLETLQDALAAPNGGEVFMIEGGQYSWR